MKTLRWIGAHTDADKWLSVLNVADRALGLVTGVIDNVLSGLFLFCLLTLVTSMYAIAGYAFIAALARQVDLSSTIGGQYLAALLFTLALAQYVSWLLVYFAVLLPVEESLDAADC